MKRLLVICFASLGLLGAASAGGNDARDGSHDFDFDVGRWTLHSWRLQHPLTGSTDWVEMEGTTVTRAVSYGRGNIAEVELSGRTGTIELLALRRYDVQAHQWSIDFATAAAGTLGTPSIGEFRNGRGDFFSSESIAGHTVLVRFSIWPVAPDVAESEQAFSDDGGKTWELNWRSRFTRIAE